MWTWALGGVSCTPPSEQENRHGSMLGTVTAAATQAAAVTTGRLVTMIPYRWCSFVLLSCPAEQGGSSLYKVSIRCWQQSRSRAVTSGLGYSWASEGAKQPVQRTQLEPEGASPQGAGGAFCSYAWGGAMESSSSFNVGAVSGLLFHSRSAGP